jgi:hypothetical protein
MTQGRGKQSPGWGAAAFTRFSSSSNSPHGRLIPTLSPYLPTRRRDSTPGKGSTLSRRRLFHPGNLLASPLSSGRLKHRDAYEPHHNLRPTAQGCSGMTSSLRRWLFPSLRIFPAEALLCGRFSAVMHVVGVCITTPAACNEAARRRSSFAPLASGCPPSTLAAWLASGGLAKGESSAGKVR